jgi:hypothetical protein
MTTTHAYVSLPPTEQDDGQSETAEGFHGFVPQTVPPTAMAS